VPPDAVDAGTFSWCDSSGLVPQSVSRRTPEQTEQRRAAWPCSRLAGLLSPELRHIGGGEPRHGLQLLQPDRQPTDEVLAGHRRSP